MKIYRLIGNQNSKEATKEKLDIYCYRDGRSKKFNYVYVRLETMIITNKAFKDYNNFRANHNLYGMNILRDITEQEFNRANKNFIYIEYEYTVDYPFLSINLKDDGKKYINLFDYKEAIKKLYEKDRG